MKMFSEEKKNNTEVLLLTSPVSTLRIVIGKYLAALVVFLIMTASTLLFVIMFYIFGAPNTQVVLGAYTAFILFGATILAINVFISSLTESQVIAAVLAFFVNIIFYFFSQLKFVFGSLSDAFVSAISPIERTKDYLMGIFAINNLIYFVITIAVMLFFTVMNIEKKRWN
jgi:ABC-2 type transport system permease protein